MFIRSARFENFTVFENAEFAFSPGINVLIGKNGTGKSHVLKALYGLAEGSRRAHLDINYVGGRSLRTIVDNSQKKDGTPEHDTETFTLLTFLIATFGTEFSLSSSFDQLLKRRRRGSLEYRDSMRLSILMNSATEALTVTVSDEMNASAMPSKSQLAGSTVYIPPREVLSMYPGFMEIYEKYRLPFERTYYDLCRALSGPLLREIPPLLAELTKPLEVTLGGRLLLDGNRFVIDYGDGQLDINLEAEGLRKIAALLQLIANGTIESGSCLFWDEPEANLNPKLVVTIKEFLVGLARAGVQVFLATHDYLLCRELSLEAEYGKTPELFRFFCLNKNTSAEAVTVEAGSLLADLQHNPIVEEFAAHYEREARLFAGLPSPTKA